jgi:hypothetical protein
MQHIRVSHNSAIPASVHLYADKPVVGLIKNLETYFCPSQNLEKNQQYLYLGQAALVVVLGSTNPMCTCVQFCSAWPKVRMGRNLRPCRSLLLAFF